ncbi:MAG: hypothetical protein WBM02_11980 [bacterium]
MAYKFSCSNCDSTIITQFLKKGEVAECKTCGTTVTVPEDAQLVNSNEPINISNRREEDKVFSSYHETSYEFKTLLGYGSFFVVLGWLGIIGGIIAFAAITANTPRYIDFEKALFSGFAVGAPIVIAGIMLIAFGQMIICFVSIERNTRATNDILRSMLSKKYL